MGKLNHGPNTKAKGKAGAFVYQQYEGMQVFKEYQPTVKNPNAPMQIATRTRFSLASKLTALLFPYLEAVMKANGIAYIRMQRADALRRLMKNTTYDQANNKALITVFPSMRQSSATSAPIEVSSVVDINQLRITATSAESMIRAVVKFAAIYIPLTGGVPFVREFSGALGDSGGSSLLTVNDTIPTGFQGSILTIGYAVQESEEMTGITYGDIAGSASTSIASLGNTPEDSTYYVVSNLGQKTQWVA